MELCTKCKLNPRADADNNNPWCLGCRAEYMRGYNSTRKEMLKQKGFQEGMREMRTALANAFEEIRGTGAFSAQEVAAMIRQAPGPLLD